ncbi:hypothetical protein PR048_012653 [Dryococelus australis]|uniref:HAT C-terminal dimerisation domain-containing protein n=1 Tax=Dryococelus australis TaxID=614101 RepID=A0ABQ9HPY6_9NEOP|nr:hypothetical protein PR048_012653 [Dryococelus australis]
MQDEWNLLQLEKDSFTESRMDDYWNYFFELKNSVGETRFPIIAILVKAPLALSHGFSSSSRYLTDDRASMCEQTLTSAMTVKSAMKHYHIS